jgi:hypothetical protein
VSKELAQIMIATRDTRTATLYLITIPLQRLVGIFIPDLADAHSLYTNHSRSFCQKDTIELLLYQRRYAMSVCQWTISRETGKVPFAQINFGG